jgi:hypothetical protein
LLRKLGEAEVTLLAFSNDVDGRWPSWIGGFLVKVRGDLL